MKEDFSGVSGEMLMTLLQALQWTKRIKELVGKPRDSVMRAQRVIRAELTRRAFEKVP